jgi:hypothetical protein
MTDDGNVTRLGNIEEGRIQRYFCVNDPDHSQLPRVSKDSRVIRKAPTTIRVQGREVKGWIVELLTPCTDGVVRLNPQEEGGIAVSETRS